MQVKRYNYPSQFDADVDCVVDRIRDSLLQGRYVLSAEVEEFEAAFAEFLEVSHVVGVNSGTDALQLSLIAHGVGVGDEVITQANTFHATVAAICLSGATPVLVDVDEDTFQIDVEAVRNAIGPKTRAVIPAHLYGQPAEILELRCLAEDRGLVLIEDAAQAHGARFQGKRVGTFGGAGCFSFHPSKNLAAAGDGGAIATNSSTVATSLRQLRNLGQREQNEHVVVGLNSKLDALQAIVLSHKLPRLDRWNEKRRAVAELYCEKLRGSNVKFQRTPEGIEHVYHLFQVRTQFRDSLLIHLQQNGVDAVVRYPTPIHRQTAFSCFEENGRYPIAEALASELLCLPIRPDMHEDEVEFVAHCIDDFFRQI